MSVILIITRDLSGVLSRRVEPWEVTGARGYMQIFAHSRLYYLRLLLSLLWASSAERRRAPLWSFHFGPGCVGAYADIDIDMYVYKEIESAQCSSDSIAWARWQLLLDR